MKKFLISLLILLFALSSYAFSEEVKLKTPYDKDVYLSIPNTYQELRQRYIDLAEMYQSQRYDLEQEIKNVDKVMADNKDLLNYAKNTNSTLNDIKAEIKKPTLPNFLNSGPLIGVGTSIDNKVIVNAGYQLQILNKFIIQVQLEYPFQANLSVGWIF
ncbi:MAG TPA: hypothetical protein VE912_15735 [Bacteroidales bacterium]|nr:hypothetical protein [Bacteroidales bacterium]